MVRICSVWGFIAWFIQNIFHCVQFHVCETQRPRMHATDTAATPNGHEMTVVTWDRSIDMYVALSLLSFSIRCNMKYPTIDLLRLEQNADLCARHFHMRCKKIYFALWHKSITDDNVLHLLKNRRFWNHLKINITTWNYCQLLSLWSTLFLSINQWLSYLMQHDEN